MALRSTRDDYQVRTRAKHNYGCHGNPTGKMLWSDRCTGIREGETYVARVERIFGERATPRLYKDVSRHCVHCALAFIPQIVVVGEQAVA